MKSEQVVKLYIERLRAVNKVVNAVVDERFNEAIEDAKKADQMCETMTPVYLLQNYPLLGVPFTVKESVGVKGTERNYYFKSGLIMNLIKYNCHR